MTKLKPKSYEDDKGDFIYTCSECINEYILDSWSYSWTTDNNKQIDKIKKNYQFTDQQIDEIRNRINNKFGDNKIGFLNVLTDLETAIEYKDRFFAQLEDIIIFTLYFDTKACADILEEFQTQSEKMGDIGLRLTLLKEVKENENEVSIGFNYIGIEIDDSFHTFYCHDIGNKLSDKFGLTLNKFSLFDSIINP